MVLNITLLHIPKRLYKIFGCSEELVFVSKRVVTVGDLLRLPPIRASSLYSPYNSAFDSLFKPRCLITSVISHVFLICEITEVMRQRGGTEFITLLNSLRVGILTKRDEELLETRKTTTYQVHDENVLFGENILKLM